MSENSESSPSSSRPETPLAVFPEPQTARPYRFNWDPSTRKPGPESVSGTTEGRGDYFYAQPRVDFLDNASSNLAVGALPSEWSSSRHGFHAISTVLNNPHKRQAPPKAHNPLPAVPPADLPRVRRKDFDSYLRAVAPEWERFEKNSLLGRDGAAHIDGPSTPRPSLTSDLPLTPRTPRPMPGRSMPSLDSVPSVFFEPDFNLGDTRTFNAVTEQDEDSRDPSSLSHSLPLLEKFSHYADTVEQHLVKEISLRSSSFFAALTNLNDLQSESEQCLDRISKLRVLLNDVDEKGAKRGLEVVRKECKIQNLNTVKESMKVIIGVMEMTGVAKSLVTAGQWGEALGIIEEMGLMWSADSSAPTIKTKSLPSLPRRNGRSSPLAPTPETVDAIESKSSSPVPIVPLTSLKAFAALPSHLRTLTMEIAASLSSELVGVLRTDLIERINGNSSPGSEDSTNQSLRDRLKPLLQGLVRTKGVREATLSWREVVLDEVRRVLKRHLPTFDVDGDPSSVNDPSTDLATHLRNLPYRDFLNLIQSIYRSFLNGIEGLHTQSAIIVDVLQTVNLSSPDPPDMQALREELGDILSSAAELSNTRAAKIVGARTEQHAALALPDFLDFFNDSWDFVVRCEVICRRMIVGLRGVVVSQSKVFLQAFHQNRISQSAKLVEDEQWNPYEVSPFLQHVTNVLIDSAVRDSPELVINSSSGPSTTLPPPLSSTNGMTPLSHSSHSPSAPLMKTNGSSPSGTGSKHLHIEERTYYVVSATSEVLILLLDYLRVIVNLSMLTTDTMSRVIEFLKAFNSRTCQVVLGAGAMRSAGLKNITAKHLALASQSLSIMIALIPYVRETFRRHLSPKQAVMLVEFDKLKRDYQEHQNEIHAKLIAIMGDRLSAHIKSLQSVNWDIPKPGGGVNDYMELLVKETVTLHKVLSRYLSAPVVEYVMTQVFAAINHRLSEEYSTIQLPHQEAKTRLLADARYLHQKLSALKNVSVPSGMLETVITEKSVPRTTPPTPSSGNVPNSAGSNTNQRLKGLLVSKSASLDKALPMPIPAPPSTVPLSASIVPSRPSSVNGFIKGQSNRFGSTNAPSPPPVPATPPRDIPTPPAGFKQVESHASKGLESPLPAPPSPPGSPRPMSAVLGISEAEGTTLREVDASAMVDARPTPPPSHEATDISSVHHDHDGDDDGSKRSASSLSRSQSETAVSSNNNG